MKNLVIFGAPGSGKGTQSDILVEKYGFDHISTGDVLRAEIKADTELGRTAKGYIDNGQLIPDSLMIDILAATYDALPKKAGVIFDGFPRTIPQARSAQRDARSTWNASARHARTQRARRNAHGASHQPR